jgi:allantoinase
MADALRLHSRHVVTPSGIYDAVIVVNAGRISEVRKSSPEALVGAHDLGKAWLLPGLVDSHVHVNEPGRTEWEGFATATTAALAGGVTTIVDMPLNSIPATTNFGALRAKQTAAEEKARVNVGFWGGVVPDNSRDLEQLARAGVLGFKCFLSPSGVDEFQNVSEADLVQTMPKLARLGLPLLVHAELSAVLDRTPHVGDPRRYTTWLASRPPEAEVEAVRMLIRWCAATRCAVHIVHLSAAECLPDLIAARERKLPITVETCPHYLCFEAEAIPDGATQFKCAPPIRGALNRERLWEALERGDIDLIASDHSPCPPEMKHPESGDFMAAWGGIASLELGLAAVWTEARARGLSVEHVVRWMSERPARLAGLGPHKGRIAVGADADLVAWRPDVEWTVESAKLHQRHKLTPYDGRRLMGQVERVFLAGVEVFAEGKPIGAPTGGSVQGRERS